MIRALVEPVSADTTDHSLSFNEFLKVMSPPLLIICLAVSFLQNHSFEEKKSQFYGRNITIQQSQLIAMKRREPPNEDNLLAVFKFASNIMLYNVLYLRLIMGSSIAVCETFVLYESRIVSIFLL